MGRKAGKETPIVRYGAIYTEDVDTTGTRLSDSARWLSWLDTADVFYYEADQNGFTARKEKILTAGKKGSFWYAYKRLNGRTRKLYLGKSDQLTADKLAETARKFAALR